MTSTVQTPRSTTLASCLWETQVPQRSQKLNARIFAVSPVCGASWARTEDICYKLITVTDDEVAEVTQAANEVDYATAKVLEQLIFLIGSNVKLNIEGLL